MTEPTLAADQAHLWIVPLDAETADAGRPHLSAEEKERAERYRFERDGARYAAARGALRRILARYLGCEAAAVALRYGPNGKPELAQEDAVFRFNLSHSGERALIAVTRDREVGVDIEALRPMPDAALMAERFFSAAARSAFARLPPQERDEGFLRLWTRQEAYLKARGDGLAGPLDETPDAHWQIRDLRPAPGYLGALALRGRLTAVRSFEFSCSRSSP